MWSGSEGSSADGNEEMEIVYAHFQGEGDAQYKSIQNAITAFEKDNPGITIKEEYYPSDAYLLQAETWSAAGELPDHLHGEWLNGIGLC